MKTHTDFLDYVMPDVPGCTVPIAELAIKNAIIEFCEKTLILQRDHIPITVVRNVVDYEFDPPTGYLIHKVMRAWYKRSPLVPIAPDDVGDAEVYNRAFAAADRQPGSPESLIQKDERTFALYPIPQETVANGVTMRVALKPTRATNKIEDVIFEDYAEAIGSGAKARLMLSPSKPYSSPQLAALEAGKFNVKINEARQKAIRGHGRSVSQIKLRSI
jgi:hypothetical protein